MTRSERYQVVGDILAYLEEQKLDDNVSVIGDAEFIEVDETLHQRLTNDNTEASTLLDNAKACEVEIYRRGSHTCIAHDTFFIG